MEPGENQLHDTIIRITDVRLGEAWKPKESQTKMNWVCDPGARCVTASDKFSVKTQMQLVGKQRLTDVHNRIITTSPVLVNISWQSNYRDTELQLQTDFKSDRKFVRVCIQEEEAGLFPEFPGNWYRCRHCHRQRLGSGQAAGRV